MAEETYYDFPDDDSFDDAETPGVGCFHVSVSDVDETGGKNHDQLVVACVVLSPGDYTGLTHKLYISVTNDEWPRKRRYKLAIVSGLTTLKKLKEGGVTIDWEDLVGKEFVINLTSEEYKGKIYIKAAWPRDYISLDQKATIAKHGCILAGSDKEDEVSSGAKPLPEETVKDTSGDEVPF